MYCKYSVQYSLYCVSTVDSSRSSMSTFLSFLHSANAPQFLMWDQLSADLSIYLNLLMKVTLKYKA